MIGIIILILLLLVMSVQSGAQRIEQANAQLRAEMGERYNPDMAGKPYRDAVVITVVTLCVLAAVVCASAPYMPLPEDNQQVEVRR